jgi:hypothetical protein
VLCAVSQSRLGGAVVFDDFCIDNASVIYTKNHQYLSIQKITATSQALLEITPVSSVSNGLYFLTLPLVCVTRVVYTSKGMSKRLGCALSIEKYGNSQ